MSEAELETEVGDDEVVLAERFRILPGSPIPELSTPGAKAYVAQNLKNPNELVLPGSPALISVSFRVRRFTTARLMKSESS